MFSGIVETSSQIVESFWRNELVQICIKKPQNFNDLSIGDSISVNGVCLTVEKFSEDLIQFALAAETLQITQWTPASLQGATVNLERSLRLNDRVHGHFVTGHVDGVVQIKDIERLKESEIWIMTLPKGKRQFFWPKGSIALNGVSLTLNTVDAEEFSVCLIPETLKRTNLGSLEVGQSVLVEFDSYARGMVHWFSSQSPESMSR